MVSPISCRIPPSLSEQCTLRRALSGCSSHLRAPCLFSQFSSPSLCSDLRGPPPAPYSPPSRWALKGGLRWFYSRRITFCYWRQQQWEGNCILLLLHRYVRNRNKMNWDGTAAGELRRVIGDNRGKLQDDTLSYLQHQLQEENYCHWQQSYDEHYTLVVQYLCFKCFHENT